MIPSDQYFMPLPEVKHDQASEDDMESIASGNSDGECTDPDAASPFISADENEPQEKVEIIEKIAPDNDKNFDVSKIKIDCDMAKEDEYDWEHYPDGSKERILPYE
jgi:hypothetical protein